MRLRVGLRASLTVGYDIKRDFGPVVIKGFAGLRGEAWLNFETSASGVINPCLEEGAEAKICFGPKLRFRLHGGVRGTAKFWGWRFSVGVSLYGHVSLVFPRCCYWFYPPLGFLCQGRFALRGAAIYAEACLFYCWRFQLL